MEVVVDILGQRAVRERLQCRFRLPLQILAEIIGYEEVGCGSLVWRDLVSSRSQRGIQVVVERVSEARGVLEERLGAYARGLLCIWVNCGLCPVKTLQRLTGQEWVCKRVDLAVELGLRVQLEIVRKCM